MDVQSACRLLISQETFRETFLSLSNFVVRRKYVLNIAVEMSITRKNSKWYHYNHFIDNLPKSPTVLFQNSKKQVFSENTRY